jgi:hypothetical protein
MNALPRNDMSADAFLAKDRGIRQSKSVPGAASVGATGVSVNC